MAQIKVRGLQPLAGSGTQTDLPNRSRLCQVLLVESIFSGLSDFTAAQGVDTSSVPDKSNADTLLEVVVTGSRVATNGSRAPTPVTVLGTEAYHPQNRAPVSRRVFFTAKECATAKVPCSAISNGTQRSLPAQKRRCIVTKPSIQPKVYWPILPRWPS
jgi:hypothetical protein